MTMLPPEVRERIAAEARRGDVAGDFPHESLRLLRNLGIVQRPAADPNFTLRDAFEIIDEVAALDASLGLLLSFQFAFVTQLRAPENKWPEATRERVLASVRDEGALVGNFATEAELGAPAMGGFPKTLLVRDEHGVLRLHGHKVYSTGIEAVRWIIVSSTFERREDGYGSVLVDREAAGDRIRIERTWDTFGMRTTRSDDVYLDGIEVLPEHIVGVTSTTGKRSAGGAPPGLGGWGRVTGPAIYNAQAKAAFAWFVDFLINRRPGNLDGKSLGDLPIFQEVVGDLWSRLDTNAAIFERLIAATPDAQRNAEESWRGTVSKTTLTENAEYVVRKIAEYAGNRGLSNASSPVGLAYRNITHAFAQGANDKVVKQQLGAWVLSQSNTTQGNNAP